MENKKDFELTKDEVSYLWSKIEALKKKKLKEEDEFFKMLNSDKTSFSLEEFTKILNSLEYSFKKKLKNGTIKTELGRSIHTKLPKDWVGIKYSVVKDKK